MPMRLTDFVVSGAILPNIESGDRNEAIRSLITALADAGALPREAAEPVAAAAIERENQGSTGFGKGVAVPHVKHPAIPKIMAAVGRSEKGIDFASLDRAPVYTVVMLLSPPGEPEAHLQAMERIFSHLQRDQFRRALRQANSVAAIQQLLKDADESSAD